MVGRSKRFDTALVSAFTALSMVLSAAAVADHPTAAFGSDARGPITTIPATAMPAGKWAIGFRNEYIERDPLPDASLDGLAAQGREGVHSIDRINSTSAALAYGLTEAITMSVRLPRVARDRIREGELEDGVAEVHGHGDASGLGDVLFLSNVRAFQANGLEASLQIGFKAPSGETHERDRGERLESEFQPGSGSWDVLIGGALSQTFGRWGLHGNLMFNLTTEGAQDTEIGDALAYNLAAVYTLSQHDEHGHVDEIGAHAHLRWDAMLEVNGETRWSNGIGGASDAHSGGTVVYLSPGLRVSYQRIGAFVSLGYPLIDDSKGVQTDVDFRLIGGVSFVY